jgi:hypothetical protein
MRRLGERLLLVGVLLFGASLVWAIMTGHGNWAASDGDDPPAALVILFLVSVGTLLLGAFFRYAIVERRNDRDWFKKYKE